MFDARRLRWADVDPEVHAFDATTLDRHLRAAQPTLQRMPEAERARPFTQLVVREIGLWTLGWASSDHGGPLPREAYGVRYGWRWLDVASHTLHAWRRYLEELAVWHRRYGHLHS